MPEETQAQQEAQASTAETTAAESQSVEQTGQTEAAANTGTEAKATEAASTGDKSKAQDSAQKESKPVSRRSAQYRIEQLVKENNALKQGKQSATQQESTETEPAAENPDISALVAKEVERRLNPLMSESSKNADDQELKELFSGDKAAEQSKYESKIRDMWKLPQYKDTAAADLYKIASFDDVVAATAAKAVEQYKNAEKEARENSTGGSSNNSNRTGKTATTMSDADILANNERIKAGQK
jgi:hypothetical protein